MFFKKKYYDQMRHFTSQYPCHPYFNKKEQLIVKAEVLPQSSKRAEAPNKQKNSKQLKIMNMMND
jgi:hypothetical protein